MLNEDALTFVMVTLLKKTMMLDQPAARQCDSSKSRESAEANSPYLIAMNNEADVGDKCGSLRCRFLEGAILKMKVSPVTPR